MKWLVLVLALLSSAVFSEEKVNSFHSDIRIAADGWMTVTETIDVNVEGRQIKRGILRDFPTDYTDRFGRRVAVPFVVVSVRRDGRDESYSVERKSNGASVRIGDPGAMLAHRRHSYEITYRTRFQVGFFDRHDELYWNVNGNGWTFAMEEISANVSVSPQLPASQIKVEAYTGPFGAKGRDYTAEALNGGASFRTTRRRAAGEGLTIVVMFPKGVVQPPTLRDRFDRWLDDNLGEVFGAAGLLVVLAFLYWRWAQVGRDPRAGPAYPRYEAPKDLGPGAVRYIDRMQYDGTCFTAALLGLAQRGFMRIREDGGTYELERTGKTVPFTPGDVPLAALVPETGPVSISATYDPAVATAQAGLAGALAKEVGARMYSRNRGTVAMGFVLAAATLFVMHAMEAALIVTIAAGAIMLAALIVAGKLLPAYTAEGRKAMDEIDGLRQYLSVAEKDDVARQKRPPRTKEEFAKFLPYAVALDVEKTWADAFTRVLGAAALATAAGEYFSSSSRDPGQPDFSPAGFGQALEGIGDTISAASTPPASSSGSSGGSSSGGSSSSSGGGSSGGGGGGGGGSGW
ncbi:MAG: DUF2207 domain-containing protein [Burkholderiales bacterium]